MWRSGVVRVIAVALIVAFGGFVLVRQYGGDVLAIDGYRPGGTPDTIIITVTAGPHGWVRVTSVDEDAQRVRITVRELTPPGPQLASGRETDLVVTLDRPLRDRTVQDSDGAPVPARRA